MGFRDRGLEIKTRDQIDLMRVAGRLVGETLELLRHAVGPDVTTLELDTLAETHIRDHGGIPSFKGYSHPPFPATICASVNDEVVHGIPGSRRLVDGDIISIDCGAIVAGWHGDAAITVPVGDIPDDVRELLRVTEESLWRGMAAARLGGRVTDISHAIETHVRAHGRYGILEDYTGHGIGTEMHMAPNVPNYGRARARSRHRRGTGPGRGTDGHPGVQGDRPARGRVDGGDRRRLDGRALRAHLHRHPGGDVGADRRRRRRGSPGRAGRPIRRTLSARLAPGRSRMGD